MQEEAENKSVALSIKTAKLTANVLKAALLKALAEMEKQRKNPKVYKGKQSVKSHLINLTGHGGFWGFPCPDFYLYKSKYIEV